MLIGNLRSQIVTSSFIVKDHPICSLFVFSPEGYISPPVPRQDNGIRPPYFYPGYPAYFLSCLLPTEVGIVQQHLPYPGKYSHDLNIDSQRPVAMQNSQ